MTELVPIGAGHQLAPAAAAAYLRAQAAGCPAGVTSSYRSPQRQADMRAGYELELAAYRAGQGPRPTFVARVEDSEHVTGDALDLPPAPEAWMRAHPGYGFVFTDPTERWHAAYRLTADQHLAGTAPAAPAPLTPHEDDDMATYITTYPHPLSSALFVLSPDLATKRHLHSIGEANVLKAGGAIEVEPGTFTQATIDRADWVPCCNIFDR